MFFPVTMCCCFGMMLYGFYHGKSPLNGHFGNIFNFFQPPFFRSKCIINEHIDLPYVI